VLERLGLPASACLALEDSENGIRSSLAAGIPTLVTESEYTRGQDFTGALGVLPDLAATTLADVRRIFDKSLSSA
jgi:beta-phosphoglucomutase-like phosphatase (HAD superfamily)